MNAIYYCISGPPQAGGQHVNVAHVVALRELGLRAYLLYIPSGKEVERFACGAPVVLWRNRLGLGEADVVVVPEAWPNVVRAIARMPCKKIIHCQNPFYVFHSFADVAAIESLGYREVLSCSGFTTDMLRRFGYAPPVHTVRPALAAEFSTMGCKKTLQIAYMPRKREIETVFVRGLFKSLYPQYRDIAWVAIKDMNHAECAQVMRESAVFASFSFIEGLGLPPLEAMASGCMVAGFEGQGGADYSRPDNGFWANEGDYFGFAHQLAKAIAASQNPARIQAEMDQTLQNYTPSSFKQALKVAWQAVLGEQYDEFLLGAG